MMRTIAITLVTITLAGCIDNVGLDLDPDAGGDPQGNPAIGTYLWARTFGGDRNDRIADVAVDSAGDVVVVGQYARTTDFGSGTATTTEDSMGFVAKYRGYDGAPLWVVPFTNEGMQNEVRWPSYAKQVIIGDNDRVIVSGWFGGPTDLGAGWVLASDCGDGFVAVYSSDGQLVDHTVLTGASPVTMAQDSAGNVLVGGSALANDCDWLQQQPDPAAVAVHQGFVTKYASDLTEVWTKAFPENHWVDIADIAIAPNDDVVITGAFNGHIDFGGGELVSHVHYNLTEGFVARLTSAGNQVWALSFPGASDGPESRGYAVSVDADNNVYVAGTFRTAIDFDGQVEYTDTPDGGGGDFEDMYLLRLDPLGKRDWFVQARGGRQMAATDVDASKPNRIFVTGSSGGRPDFGGGKVGEAGGAFVVSYDSVGDYVGSRSFTVSTKTNTSGFAIKSGPGGRVVAAGNFAGTSDFGGGPVSSTNDLTDAFVTVFTPR